MRKSSSLHGRNLQSCGFATIAGTDYVLVLFGTPGTMMIVSTSDGQVLKSFTAAYNGIRLGYDWIN